MLLITASGCDLQCIIPEILLTEGSDPKVESWLIWTHLRVLMMLFLIEKTVFYPSGTFFLQLFNKMAGNASLVLRDHKNKPLLKLL